MIYEFVLFTHVAATGFMTGIIWFVQIVHYPLMAGVGHQEFSTYELEHQRRTRQVVAPAMIVEALLAIALVAISGNWLAWAGLLLVGLVWGSTFVALVPMHTQLQHGLDRAVVARLVGTNWVRTAAWSARLVLALEMVRRGVVG